MSAFDEFHGGFTLADAAVTHDEHAFTVHLHQHAVTGEPGCQLSVQEEDQRRDKGGGILCGGQQRNTGLLCCIHHALGCFQPLCQDYSRRIGLEEFQVPDLGLLLGIAVHKDDLALAQNLGTALVKYFKKASQLQTRTVYIRTADKNFIRRLGQGQHLQIKGLDDLFQCDFISSSHNGSPLRQTCPNMMLPILYITPGPYSNSI